MSTVLDITKDTFKTQVGEDKTPILIDFWAPWCGPCRAMGPILHDVASQLEGEVRVAKVNVDNEREIAEAFGIRSIPTILLIKDLKIVDSVIGVMPAERLVSQVRSALSR